MKTSIQRYNPPTVCIYHLERMKSFIYFWTTRYITCQVFVQNNITTNILTLLNKSTTVLLVVNTICSSLRIGWESSDDNLQYSMGPTQLFRIWFNSLDQPTGKMSKHKLANVVYCISRTCKRWKTFFLSTCPE